MGAKLYIQTKTTEPFEVRVGNTATIGRTRENTISLHFSQLVSRQHALIRCLNAQQYQIIDLGSRNGTYVNDQRVVMPVILEPGAVIRIADNTLTFLEDDPEEEDVSVTVAATSGSTDTGIVHPVALLVCDIRGFSTMSERVPPGDLAQLLGKWFREAANAVQTTQGTIDKFIGDALLAYWAAAPDCDTVLGLARRLVELAAERTWPEGETFCIAVALHYGPVTFSDMGLAGGRDATIIGDAVNTVFRLEAVSKDLQQAVVLSEAFVERLKDAATLTDFGEQNLKGKTQMVRVFGLPD